MWSCTTVQNIENYYNLWSHGRVVETVNLFVPDLWVLTINQIEVQSYFNLWSVDNPFSRNTLWVNTPTHIFGPVMHIHANTEYGQPAICGECLRCHSTITYRNQFQFQVYISRTVETREIWQVLGSWISVSEVKTHLRRAEDLRGWRVKSPSYQNQPSYFTGI